MSEIDRQHESDLIDAFRFRQREEVKAQDGFGAVDIVKCRIDMYTAGDFDALDIYAVY